MSSFEDQINAFIRKARENPKKVTRQVSIKLFSAVIQASPVDTGRFRANWQATTLSPAAGTVNTTDRSGATTISHVTTTVAGSTNASQFYLTNNLPYAEKLEYGYSNQAPQGFVRTNVSRFQALIDEAARRVI